MKKTFLVFAAAIISFGTVYADTQVVGGYTWYYNVQDNKATIVNSGYRVHWPYGLLPAIGVAISTSPSGTLVVPNTLGGKPVVGLGSKAFMGCNLLKKLILPNSITSIGNQAFDGCASLESITIPDSVTSIGGSAFYNCSNLVSVTIPDSVVSIGYQAFDGCASLKSITIPDSVTSIGGSAFYNCSNLVSVTIPDSVVSIGSYAFSGCTSLTNVVIPNSVPEIQSGVFSRCSKLTSLSIGDGVVKVSDDAFDGCRETLFDVSTIPGVKLIDGWVVGYTNVVSEVLDLTMTRGICDKAFENCVNLRSVKLPSCQTEIGCNTFSGCTSLESISIPDSVTSIGYSAFSGCTSLAHVNIPNSVKRIEGDPFLDCNAALYDTEIIPGLKVVDGWAVGFLDTLEGNLDLTGVVGIADGAFAWCSGITSVYIPASVEFIGEQAFELCDGLNTVIIENGVKYIGYDAFYCCTSLKNITIPNSVTNIGDSAFYDCSGLTSITIPDSVNSIGDSAFYGCSGLTSITIPDSVKSIGDSAFYDCSGLTSITIPDSVKSVGNYAFEDCSGLTSITIPDGVKSVGNYAFEDCSNLINASIGTGVEKIGSGVFCNCDSLTTISVGVQNLSYKSIKGMLLSKDGKTLVAGVNGNVEIPEGVTEIAERAFSGLSRLTSLKTPDSLEYIGDAAFSYCGNLKSARISGTKTSIGGIAFAACKNLAEIEFPDSLEFIGSLAFHDCSGVKSVTLPQYVCACGLPPILPSAYSSITNVVISDSVEYIGDKAFKNCAKIDNVLIPDGVERIGSYAFSNCSGLSSISIPDSVTSIGSYSFQNCTSLRSITIPESITRIGVYAFSGCYSLREAILEGDVFQGYDALLSNANISQVYFSTRFAKNWIPVFENYPHIEVFVPEELRDCEIFEEVVLGRTWRYYREGQGSVVCSGGFAPAVSGFDGMGIFAVPETLGGYPVVEIGFGAFEGVEGLKSVSLPPTVTNIADYAFYRCSGLDKMTVSNSIKSIGNFAFTSCTSLTNVIFEKPSSLLRIGRAAFRDCYSIVEKDFVLPESVMEIGVEALQFTKPKTLCGVVDGELSPGATYIVSSNIVVKAGSTLIIPRGVVLKFASGCSMTVNGVLDAQGTRAAPIVFTSLKDDEHGGDTNADGDKTYAQPGDWARIYAGGTLNMNHCIIRHCNNTSDQGAIQGTGGNVTFDNGLIESSVYECVRMNSGSFTAHNSVFRDASMGFGYYGGSGVYVYNCVVADCTIGCRASNKHFYNTVFYKCQTFLESTSSSCSHCVFYNPPGYGAQSAAQVGSNGNVWGDPQFADPDNGDFTIAATSPCVDAGDGMVAPETDYWGRPRMDVKAVADTGKPNADGVCPDIGICEVDGEPATPLPDLAVLSVATSATLPVSVGDELTVTYVVTNRGGLAVSGTWRDTVTFFSDYGTEVAALTSETTAKLVAGGAAATFTKKVRVPAVAEGEWGVRVEANAYRDIAEISTTDNNRRESETRIAVSLAASSLTEFFNGKIRKGELIVKKYSAVGGDYALEITAASGATIDYGIGAMPTGANATTVGSRGVAYVSIPAGETVYVTISGDKEGAVSIRPFAAGKTVRTVSPATLPQSGEATLTVDGLHLGDVSSIRLVNGSKSVSTKSLRVEKAERLTAKFDCSELAAGTKYAIVAETEEGASAWLANAVTVSGVKGEAKLSAKLEMPASLRQGRSFVFYIDYANTGNIDMPAPIFTVKSDQMIFTTDYGTYTNSVKLIGLGATGSAGVIRAGESFRLPVRAQVKPSASGGVKYSLSSSWTGSEGADARLPLASFFSENYAYWHGEEVQEEYDVISAKLGATWRDFYRNLGEYVTHLDGYRLASSDYGAISQDFAWQCVREAEAGWTRQARPSRNFAWQCVREATAAESTGAVSSVALATPVAAKASVASKGKSLLGAGESGGRTLAFFDANDRSEFFALWGTGVPKSQAELRYRYEHMNPILGRDNSYPGDIWIFMDGTNWTNARWTCITNNSGEVSANLKAGVETFVICHGNLHSVHSEWIADMAVALKARMDREGKACNILAIDWGDEATAPMTATQVSAISGVATFVGGALGNGLANTALFNGLMPLYYPEFAFATALDIPDVADKAYDTLDRMFSLKGISPSDVTMIGHSHGGHVTGNIAGHFARSGRKIGRLVGMETSSFSSHQLVMPWRKFGQAWDGASASRTEFYKTSYWMSMGSFAADGDEQVFGHYNFFVVPKTDWEGGDAHFEYQGVLSGGSNKAGNSYLMNVDADTDEGRLNAWRHDQVELWFIETIRDENKWANLGFNLKGDEYASSSLGLLGMPIDAPSSHRHGYHGVINWKTGKLELSKPDGWKGEWRYGEQVLDGPGRTSGSRLDDLQNRVTQAIEYRIEKPTIPDSIDDKNRKITFSVTNAADNLSIDYDDINKKWVASNNEAWGPWQKDVGIGVWLCRPSETSEAGVAAIAEGDMNIAALRGSGMKWQRIKNWKIDGLDRFTRPQKTNFRQFSLDISYRFGSHQIADDGEDFLLVIGAGVSSKGSNSAAPSDYFGDLCPTNNYVVKKVHVKPTNHAVVVINGNEYEDGDTANILVGETQTSVALSITVQSQVEGIFGHKWSSERGTFADAESQTTTWRIEMGTENDSMEATLNLVRTITIRETGETYTLDPESVRVRFVRKKKEPQDDNGGGDSPVPQSCDPNEVLGPDGLLAARYVQPGEWLNYTIFFENKSDASAAAQFVTVDNPLSGCLDWSSFEMGDVGFGTQIDTGLMGKKNGTSEVTMDGTNLAVRTEVTMDEDTGKVSWFLRIVSPYGDSDGWPYADDSTGFLPPNDETHRGEGHLTYRIKVRDDAPAGVVITNSATIVFDYNEPIETNPAWWNTVAQMAAVEFDGGAFEERELIVGEPYGELPEPAARTGYKFGGWYTGPNGTGRKITAQSIVQSGDSKLYEHWTANTYTVTFDAAGGTGGWSKEMKYGEEMAVPTVTRAGYEFKGWSPATGLRPVVPAHDVMFVAQWEVKERTWIAEDEDVVPSLAAASVWDGWVVEGQGSSVKGQEVKGVVQVKVGKANKRTGEAKVTASVTMLGERKQTVKMTPITAENHACEGMAKDGTAMRLEFGERELRGSYGAYEIVGAVNGFVSKDKAAKASAEERLAPWLGPVNVAWPGEDGWNTLSVTIARKGKAKAAGTLWDGTKLTGAAQLVQGDKWSAVPVLVTKKVPMAFMLWLGDDGTTIETDGLPDGAVAGKPGTLAAGSAFEVDADAFAAALGDATFKDYLPDGVEVLQNGKKLAVAKGGKVVYVKGTTEVDELKAGENPAALKLTYTQKTGAFKGSFKAYIEAKGKPKALTAKIVGVLVDGVAYGTATIKKVLGIGVRIL